jgi:hypothetical protein
MSRWLHRFRIALRSIVRGKHVERELDEELRFHLERETHERLKAGLTPDEARQAALRAMGAVEKHKEECRDLRNGLGLAGSVRALARCRRRPRGSLKRR